MNNPYTSGNNPLASAIIAAQIEKKLTVTLWDVGHGLAIWVQTPNGHNHIVDAGWNDDFCPGEHIAEAYHEDSLDYLVISHPDADHIQGLPGIVEHLGSPRVLLRNKTLPSTDKFGGESKEYQKAFKSLDARYTSPVNDARNPCNSSYNGGVTVKHAYLTYELGLSKNDSSVVLFYAFGEYLFVFPGDIEDSGWKKLWAQNQSKFQPLIDASSCRILVAPHHGRESGYSQDMVDAINPSLVLISDKWGQSPTDPRFRTCSSGIEVGEETVEYYSTKSGGRMQFVINQDGECTFDQQ